MYRKTYHRGTFKSLATLAMLHHRVADSRDVDDQDVAVGDKGEKTEKSNPPILNGLMTEDTEDEDLTQYAQGMLKIFSSARETEDYMSISSDESLISDDESKSGSDESDSSSSDDSGEDSHATTPHPQSFQELVEWAKEQDEESKIKKNLKPLIKQLCGFRVDDDTMLLVFHKLDLLYSYQIEHRKLVGNILAEKYTADILQCLSNLLCYDSANTEQNKLVKLALRILWEYTDSSEELAKEIAEHDGIAMMTQMLKKSFLRDQNNPEIKDFIPQASLSILHNLARDPSLKRKFDKAKTAKAVIPWLDDENEFNRMVAALTLAHIDYSDTKKKTRGEVMEERNHGSGQSSSSDRNKQTPEEPDTVMSTVIERCVAWLTEGLKLKDRRVWGFSVWDLTLGLAKLAISDANKSKIIAEGALPAFLQVLNHTDDKEQLAALECLGTLSFEGSARKSIEQFPELVVALKNLTESGNTEIKKNAQGLLWRINEGNATTSKSDLDAAKPPEFEYDVFISYSHQQKKLIHKINAALEAAKLKVWLDEKDMKDSIFDGMLEAVETSAVVLLCMSDEYQDSPHCRLEAELTVKRQRAFIPLVVSPKYKPTRWLDVVIGANLWIDFAGQQSFELSMMKLLPRLKEKISSSRQVSHGRRRSAIAPTAPNHSQPSFSKAITMTPDDTLKFLESKGLANIPQELTTLDGKVLGKLKELKETDVKYFYQTMKEDFGMSVVDILKLSAALDDM